LIFVLRFFQIVNTLFPMFSTDVVEKYPSSLQGPEIVWTDMVNCRFGLPAKGAGQTLVPLRRV